jgi:hypothetical protein
MKGDLDRELSFSEEGWLAPAVLDGQIACGKEKSGGEPPFLT